MPILTSLDPSKPTYIGTDLGHYAGYAYYFEGMMYGFNWGIVSEYSSGAGALWTSPTETPIKASLTQRSGQDAR